LNIKIWRQEVARAILGQTQLVFSFAREFPKLALDLIEFRSQIGSIGMAFEMRRERTFLEFQGDFSALFSEISAQL